MMPANNMTKHLFVNSAEDQDCHFAVLVLGLWAVELELGNPVSFQRRKLLTPLMIVSLVRLHPAI